MGWWSLNAFLDDTAPSMTVDELARECVKATGEITTAEYSDEFDPFDGERLGVRVTWGTWSIRVAQITGPDVIADAIYLSSSKAPPAETRRRVKSCTRRIQILFGPDDEGNFTDHTVSLIDYLEHLSDNRVYDPQQRNFTSHKKGS